MDQGVIQKETIVFGATAKGAFADKLLGSI